MAKWNHPRSTVAAFSDRIVMAKTEEIAEEMASEARAYIAHQKQLKAETLAELEKMIADSLLDFAEWEA